MFLQANAAGAVIRPRRATTRQRVTPVGPGVGRGKTVLHRTLLSP